MRLDIYDREILRYLLQRHPTATTTNYIATHLKLSWNTVRTHLDNLHSQKLVLKYGTGIWMKGKKRTINFWKVNRDEK